VFFFSDFLLDSFIHCRAENPFLSIFYHFGLTRNYENQVMDENRCGEDARSRTDSQIGWWLVVGDW
jgi:hypothetical protein